MQTVILVIHLMVVVALVGVVLLQRSEGGALGIGGGGGFMTSRGTANVLTRTTAILAAVFFATSLALSVLPRFLGTHGSILDNVAPSAAPAQPDTPIGSGSGGVLNDLNNMVKQRQQSQAPADQPVAPAIDVPSVPGSIPEAPAAETPAAPAAETPAAPVTEAPAAPAAEAPAATDSAAPATTETPAAPAQPAPAQ